MKQLQRTSTAASLFFFSMLSTLLVSAEARAADAPVAETTAVSSTSGLDNSVSAFGMLGYWYSDSGLGIGARYQKTLVPRGVLRLASIRDDIGLEGGIDYFRYSFSYVSYGWTYNEIAVLVGTVWNFWFLDGRLALYPKIDIGYRFGSWSANTGISSPTGYGGLVFQGSAGAAYKIGRLALRGEVGSGSLRVGAGFAF